MPEPLTSKQANPPNPSGKGGFRDNPQNRNPNGRPKHGISYWMNRFLEMNIRKFKAFEKIVPERNRTMAQAIAYVRVMKARKDLNEAKEVADRTDGKPKQNIGFGDEDSGITHVNVDIAINKDATQPSSDNGIREELPAVPDPDPLGSESGGEQVK